MVHLAEQQERGKAKYALRTCTKTRFESTPTDGPESETAGSNPSREDFWHFDANGMIGQCGTKINGANLSRSSNHF